MLPRPPGRLSVELIVAFVLTTLLLVPTARAGKQTPASATPPPEVSVVQVTTQTVPIFREFVASTYSKDLVEIRARVDGFIEEKRFESGRSVKQGDVLYVLDLRPYLATVKETSAAVARAKAELEFAKQQVERLEAEARLKEAEANLIKAKQDYSRTEPLVAKSVASKEDLDVAIAGRDAAQATYNARLANVEQKRLTTEAKILGAQASYDGALAKLEQANLELEYATIRAPISGFIGDSLAPIGALVTKNSVQPLTTIAPLDPISVRFSLSEADYLQTRRAEGATSTVIPLYLLLADGSVHPYIGTIERAENQVNAKTGTLELQADFPNPKKTVLPGQFGRVRAQVAHRKDTILIPQRAIVELQGMQSVIAVDATTGKAMARSVVISERIGNLCIVEQGLKPGDLVVIEGVQKARPGTIVKSTIVPLPPPKDDFLEQVEKLASKQMPAETSASAAQTHPPAGD